MIGLVERLESILKEEADEYLLKARDRDRLMVKVANGEVSVVQSWSIMEIQVYVVKGRRIGISSFQALDVEDALKKLPQAISRVQPSPFYAPLPEPTGKPLSMRCSKIVETVSTGEVDNVISDLKISEMGDSAGMIELEHWNTCLRGSNGVDLSYEGTKFDGYLRVFRNGRSGQWAWTSTTYEPKLAIKAVEKAVELAEEASKLPKIKVEPGNYRVLISPMIVGNLVGRIADAASAFSLIMGLSFFQDKKVGDKVADENFSLYDKPLDTTLPGFRGFDDEGVRTRNKPLIENGVFKGLIHNSKTAKFFGTESTGNAGWISPTPFNLEVRKGDLKVEEMYEVLRNGLYLTNNWYTRFQNFIEGEFSTVTRDAGFLVKDGELAGYVDRVRIADRMLRVFSNVEAATNEEWNIQWWEVRIPTRTPHLLVSDVKITLPE